MDWIYLFELMALSCPSVADCKYSPASPPAGPTVWQWVTAFINLLQTLLLACKQFILFVWIDGINLPSVADFLFTFLLFWPPAALTTCSGWQHLWTIFTYHFWYVNVLFGQFKLIPMTCITVAGFFFIFSPITPCKSYCWPWVRSILWTSLLVFNLCLLSAQIDGIDLPFCCRFHFRYFAFLTSYSFQYSATAHGIYQLFVDIIYGI